MSPDSLATVVSNMGFADCRFIATDGKEFAAHRVIVGRHAKLKELITSQRRVDLRESAEVVEALLAFIYGARCEILEPRDPEKDGDGWLRRLLVLRAAAAKYDISDSKGDLAFQLTDQIGRMVKRMTSVKTAALRLRELLNCKEDSVTLQKVIVGRLLELIEAGEAAGGNGKRKRELADVLSELKYAQDGEFEYPDVITVPKKLKHDNFDKENVAITQGMGTKPIKPEGTHEEQPKLHCICQEPEDAYLVQCENCTGWFHPNCLGKGKYAKSTTKARRLNARKGDEEYYRTKGLTFRCLNCDVGKARSHGSETNP